MVRKLYQMFEDDWRLCFQGFYESEKQFLGDTLHGYEIDVKDGKFHWLMIDCVQTKEVVSIDELGEMLFDNVFYGGEK